MLLGGYSLQFYREWGRSLDASHREFHAVILGDAITDHATKSDSHRLVELTCNPEMLQMWGAYLVNSGDKDFPVVVNAFFRYAEIQEHKPLFVDMALATFVVCGYEYDAAKGRYKLNEGGKRLLDYALAHPLPKILPIARVLKERWDKDALMKMIQTNHQDVKTWDDFERKVDDVEKERKKQAGK